MSIFSKKTVKDWLEEEDQYIDEIMRVLRQLPNLANTTDEVNGLLNDLSNLRLHKDAILARNISEKIMRFQTLLSDLTTKFNIIEQQNKKITQIGKSIAENCVLLTVYNLLENDKEYKFLIEKTQPFILGRSNIPNLHKAISKTHLRFNNIANIDKKKSLKYPVSITALGSNETIINSENIDSQIIPNNKEFLIQYNDKVNIGVGPDCPNLFSFVITNFSSK